MRTRRVNRFLPPPTHLTSCKPQKCLLHVKSFQVPRVTRRSWGQNRQLNRAISATTLPKRKLFVLPTGGHFDVSRMTCGAFEPEAQAKVGRWAGNLVFGRMGRMWAGLEGSSDIYQVDASCIVCGGIRVNPCRDSPENTFSRRAHTGERGWTGRRM